MNNLVDRAIKLSHFTFHKKNLTFIKDFLLHNNYPLNVIELYVKKHLKKLSNTRSISQNNNNNKKLFISLPYVKEMENFINLSIKNTTRMLFTVRKIN